MRRHGKEELWERLDETAKDRETTANQLLAAQWLENREWLQTDVLIQAARSSLFTAQAIARNMIAARRGDEVEEIRRKISTVVLDLPNELSEPAQNQINPSDSTGRNA